VVQVIKSLQDPLEVGNNLPGINDNVRERGVEQKCFRRWQKVDRDGADITLSGRLFQMVSPFDCSLKKITVSFIVIFGRLSFAILATPPTRRRVSGQLGSAPVVWLVLVQRLATMTMTMLSNASLRVSRTHHHRRHRHYHAAVTTPPPPYLISLHYSLACIALSRKHAEPTR